MKSGDSLEVQGGMRSWYLGVLREGYGLVFGRLLGKKGGF